MSPLDVRQPYVKFIKINESYDIVVKVLNRYKLPLHECWFSRMTDYVSFQQVYGQGYVSIKSWPFLNELREIDIC